MPENNQEVNKETFAYEIVIDCTRVHVTTSLEKHITVLEELLQTYKSEAIEIYVDELDRLDTDNVSSWSRLDNIYA